MTVSQTQIAQQIATAAGLSPDEGLFLQNVPAALLSAIATGKLDLAALACEELTNRHLSMSGKWQPAVAYRFASAR